MVKASVEGEGFQKVLGAVVIRTESKLIEPSSGGVFTS